MGCRFMTAPLFLRGIGAKGAPGWPDSPTIEALRTAWLGTEDPAQTARICRTLQEQVWQDVPFILMGGWLRKTAYRGGLVDRPVGFPLFWGIRWA
jgi:peptide/nickel transport system substrate-binding protein